MAKSNTQKGAAALSKKMGITKKIAGKGVNMGVDGKGGRTKTKITKK